MSGPSTLGTLLSQRLDAVMGQTLAKHAVLLDTRPGAAAQPVDRSLPPTPVNRRSPDNPLPGQERAGGRRADATETGTRVGREGAQPAGRQAADGSNASTRATLSAAARLILTLLADRPQAGPGQIAGRQPLWRASPDTPGSARPSGERTSQDSNPGTAQRPAAGGRPSAGATAPGAGAATANNGSNPARGTDGASTAQNARPAAGSNPQTGTPAPATGANAGPAGQATAQTAVPGPQVASGIPTAAAPANTPAAAGAATAAAQTQAAPTNNGMPSAQVFVRALSQALQSSGLFYESHLSKVAFGRMPANELMREPQARFATQRGSERLAPSAAGQSGPQGAITHTSTQTGMPPEAAALVRQQLETLAHSAIHWSGDAWPDAPMEWEVSDETHDADPHARHWATRLSISLPNLGLVEARIQLSGMQLVMHLDAPNSAELLQAEGEVLRDRYTAGGFTLSSFQVGDEPVAAPGTSPDPNTSRPAPANDAMAPSAAGGA